MSTVVRLAVLILAGTGLFTSGCNAMRGTFRKVEIPPPPGPGEVPPDVYATTLDQLKLEGGELYRCGINDVIAVRVYNFPEFSAQAMIRSDGRISVPLIGDVEVVDLTPTEISQKIDLRLKDFVKQDLFITTSVTRFNSQKFYVFGEVSRPGPARYQGRMTLFDALSRSGYNRIRSRLTHVIVFREGRRLIMPGRREPWWKGGGIKASFDMKATLVDGNMDENVVIKANDVVYVPRTFFAWVSDIVYEVTMPISTALRITEQIYRTAGTVDAYTGDLLGGGTNNE
jgi:polysaccharide export outer membrane protein